MAAGLARTAEVSDMAGHQPGAAAAGAQAPALQRADGTPIRVLVVDDEPSLAELLASVLRYEGWEIRTAGDGASAVRAARDFRPDAVVLDIMLPDFDGLEVMRRVRARLLDEAVQPGTSAGAAARAAAPDGDRTLPQRHRARRRRPDHGRGCPRGPPRGGADRADRDGVRAAAL